MLLNAGYSAFLIHERANFKVDWLSLKLPVLYWDKRPKIHSTDIVIVPEVMANLKGLKELPCKKILFVQATSFLFEMLPDKETHLSLGFEKAIATMPHMVAIIEEFTGLKVDLIPPFVADYFYKEEETLHEREKVIIIYPKFHQQDYSIIRRLIRDKLSQQKSSIFSNLLKRGWRLVEMKDKTHQQVAELMQKATFFIATNTFESFNVSVPEAMAAGCINICYEGFGPRDYLKNNVNAFVFANNEAYALCRHVFNLIDTFEHPPGILNSMRTEGRQTVNGFSRENTRQALLQYVENTLVA